eukprot:5720234-Pleurochrysis_carterae.AAC.1
MRDALVMTLTTIRFDARSVALSTGSYCISLHSRPGSIIRLPMPYPIRQVHTLSCFARRSSPARPWYYRAPSAPRNRSRARCRRRLYNRRE